MGQIVNFFYSLAGEVAGAEAFATFDTLLAPFIRYDRLDFPAVKQALQEFIFNLNVATRVGFQAPFTNLTFDLRPPAILVNEPVIVGGEPQGEAYAEFVPDDGGAQSRLWKSWPRATPRDVRSPSRFQRSI